MKVQLILVKAKAPKSYLFKIKQNAIAIMEIMLLKAHAAMLKKQIPAVSSWTSNSAPADPRRDAPCFRSRQISNLSKRNRSEADDSPTGLSQPCS